MGNSALLIRPRAGAPRLPRSPSNVEPRHTERSRGWEAWCSQVGQHHPVRWPKQGQARRKRGFTWCTWCQAAALCNWFCGSAPPFRTAIKLSMWACMSCSFLSKSSTRLCFSSSLPSKRLILVFSSSFPSSFLEEVGHPQKQWFHGELEKA